METDVKKIKKLSEEKEDENWDFRSFLKMGRISSRRVDSIVHRLYEEISSQIDCKACANCCKDAQPVLDQEDIERLSTGLGISIAQFRDQYLVKDEEEARKYRFSKTPCPFLKDNACSCHAHRPADCISYPHLHKKDFTSRTIDVIGNCSICPIVYNVCESLKREVWRRR